MDTNKKVSLKKILKITGFIFLTFIILLVAAPFIFKSKIIELIKRGVNENLNAVVDFGEVDISLIRSFPRLNLKINDLSVKGVDEFEDVYLLKTDQLVLDLSVMEFFRDNANPSIYYLGLKNADLNLIIIDEESANYLITKESEEVAEPVDFNLKLSKYEISNANILYLDNLRKTKIDIKGLNHRGSGNLSAVVYNLHTQTTAESLTLNYDGNTYIDKAKTNLSAILNIDMENMKFSFLDNELILNRFPAKLDGYLQLLEDKMDIDLSFSSPSTSFKDILSIVPGAYTSDFDKVNATGSLAFAGLVKGSYSDTPASLPGFSINLKIDNASLKYPDMPAKLSGLYTSLDIKAQRPDYKDLSINIPDFRFRLNDEPVSGKLKIDNGMTDAIATGELKGKINLQHWLELIPMEGISELKGIVNSDMVFRAKQSDIIKENYSAINFDGGASVESFIYRSADMPPISMKYGKIEASPSKIRASADDLKLGKSDMDFTGEILHPLAFLTPEKDVVINMNLSSKLLDLNEWMTETPKEESTEFNLNDYKVNEFKNVNINANARMERILFAEYDIKNLIFKGKYGNDQFIVDDMSMILDGSDVRAQGKFSDFISYLTDNGTVKAEMSFQSKRFDTNPFMVNSSPSSTPENIRFDVPQRVSMKLDGKVDQLIYTNMELKNTHGTIIIDGGKMYITDVTTNALGGNFAFDGTYDSSGDKPKFDFKLDLSKIKFAEAVKQMESFKALMPVAEYMQGMFNTSLSMSGFLGANMIPDLTTLNAKGLLETIHGNLRGFEPINRVADKLGLNQLQNINLDNTKNWFEIKDGTVEITPIERSVAGIDLNIQGLHRIGREMDFTIMMHIPRQLMQKSGVTAAADKGLNFIEKEAGRVGLNIAQGDHIDLRVKLGGRINSPTFTITPVGTSGKSVKDEVKEEIDTKVSQFKDTVSSTIRAKEQQLRDTVSRVITNEVDRAKAAAEERARELAEQAKQEAERAVRTQVESTVGQAVGDSLKDRAKEVIGEKKDEIKDKIKEFNPFGRKKGGG